MSASAIPVLLTPGLIALEPVTPRVLFALQSRAPGLRSSLARKVYNTTLLREERDLSSRPKPNGSADEVAREINFTSACARRVRKPVAGINEKNQSS